MPNAASPNARLRSPIARFAGLIAGGLSALLRNAPFALFLGAILCYGGLFAWRMLDRFDLVNLLRDVNGDDSFYYFQIARNLAEGKFSTFDGGMTRTNGYHPLWMLLITPFYWVFDPQRALFAIKAFEILLTAGGVALIVLAARLARLPWILLFAALPMLYRLPVFFGGMESAAGLFMLSLLFLTMVLFTRNPARWTWPPAAAAFALPWVRLEFAAVSVAATAALWLIERPHRERMPGASSALQAGVPLFGACSGILAYFAYNQLVFGGAVPVSGAIRQVWSQQKWESEGGYSLASNFRDVLQVFAFGPGMLLMSLGVCACFLMVLWSTRRARKRDDRLLLIFLAAALGLAVGHVAKFVQTVLTVHPYFGSYSHYFVPLYLTEALIVPVLCYVALHLVRRFVDPRLRGASHILRPTIVVVCALVLFMRTDFTAPFQFVDRASEASEREFEISDYLGAQAINRVLPENSVIGSWDSGVLGYFSRFPVVNLDGVVNTWDYLHARREGTEATFFRQYGITHFANVRPVSRRADTALFEGSSFLFEGKRKFMLWSAKPAGDVIDRSARFWERMAPHFDFESASAAVVVDNNLAQAFAKDCKPAEIRDTLLAFSWLTEEGEMVSRWWRPWENAGRNRLGLCVAAFELPNDAGRPMRIAAAPSGSIHYGNRLYLGEQELASFEAGFDGWLPKGEAVTNHGRHERYKGQQPISGNKGPGFLTSYHPDKGDRVTGRALSPEFAARADQHLVFLIAGGAGAGVGLRLLADGEEAAVWRGRNAERFRIVVHPLAGVAGKRLQLELFDHETGGWGHIMLDHVMLVRQQSNK